VVAALWSMNCRGSRIGCELLDFAGGKPAATTQK
jgi:hypothetical protein